MAETKEDEHQTAIIELDEEQQGSIIELENSLFFKKIGDAIPMKPYSSNFDLENPPTQALAVSESPQAVFLAHSEGFYVAKTTDVIEGAKLSKEKGKGCCIEELCVVDVQIGRVRILAASKDNSTLAVCVGAQIHFFSITSLLNKEQEPLRSCSVDEVSCVKDFRWRKKSKSSFLVLSRDGVLYRGDLDSPLKEVMDNVDAVDWSTGGHFIAVAKKNFLSIFSSRFRKRFTMSIPFTSCTNDTDSKCIIKVDSINWVRHDSIVLGCFQITEDGKEDGYLIQIISSKDGNISEAASKPVVLSFDGAFPCINDNLPLGCGPHLFLNYLEHRELAVVANKKNTEQHVVLFGWSLDDEQKEPALIEFAQEDRWLPRIGLQDNDDENLIMGFGVDTVSLHEKVLVELGVEQKELSPYCILLCLTFDGKLLMFYVAGVTENPDSPKIVSDISDEEEDSSVSIPLACDSSKTSSRFEEHIVEGTFLYAKPPETSQEELERKGGGDILKDQKNELKDNSKIGLHVDDLSNRETTSTFSMSFPSAGEIQDKLQPQTANKEVRTVGGFPPSIENQQNANRGSQSLISGRQSSNFEKSSEKSPLFYGSDSILKEPRKSDAQKPAFASSGVLGTSSFTGNISGISHSKNEDSHSNDVVSNAFSRNVQRDGVPSASSGSQFSHKFSFLDEFNSRLSSTEVNRGEQSGSRVGNTGQLTATGTQSSSDFRYSNTLNIKDRNTGPQFSINTSGRSTPIGGHISSTGIGKLEPEPAMRNSQVYSSRGSTSHNPMESKLQSTQESFRSPPSSYGMASEQAFSKHFGNVNEMAKELDTLLSHIEGDGGFRDACIIFQKSSVLEIEQGLDDLTERCRMWKSKMEERLEGVHHLLDQTVQVLARKIYIEGIVKQASDSQYWDLWNRQKLTPELELKRRQILKVNQDLTNQLIELEKHFNTLELNKFGENSRVPTARRVLQSGLRPSRDGQAYNRLYNTMSSQLAAAEQLSECLTKQMAVLNIESPSAKRKFVAKELFESIGLAYDGDSFNSPNMKKAVHSPESVKKLTFSSASAAIKEQSRRNPSSVVKSFESETARRRVSLDRSWASFEPPKTTVKRILLQEDRPRLTANKLSLGTNKEGSQKWSSVSHPRDSENSMPSLHPYVNKDGKNRFQLHTDQDIQDKAPKQASPTLSFKWTNDLSGKSQSTNMKSSALQVTQKSNLMSSTSILDSTLSPSEIRNNTNESFGFVSDRSSIGSSRFSISDKSKVQPIPFSNAISNLSSESSLNQRSSTTILAPAQIPALPKKTPHEVFVSVPSTMNHGDTAQTKATSGPANDREVNQENSVSVPVKSRNSPFTFPASPATSFRIKSSQLETVIKEAQSGVSTVSPPISVSPSVPSLSPPIKASMSMPSSSSFTSFTKPEATIKQSTDAKVPSASSYSSSSYSTPSLVSPSPFSIPTMEPKPTFSESKPGLNASQASPSPLEPTSAAPALTPAPTLAPAPADGFNTSVPIDAKNDSPDLAANQEDEMEEEASDMTTNLSLGGFGGFGLGSAPTSVTPKSNPFGGTFQNAVANPTNSPFNLTVPSGQLFRPASFSLQPSQPASQSAFSSHFTAPDPTRSAFGQPANIGPGQQALGSVLGAFGQSRQLGTSPPGTGFSSTTAFGTPPTGGFSNVATGGFAGVASNVGGFSGVASGGGGFAGAAASAGGGFAGAGSAGGGGGFGAFSNQQGGSGFPGFGGGSAESAKSPMFMQMRK